MADDAGAWQGRYDAGGLHICPRGHVTQYQVMSGGREWWCPGCEGDGHSDHYGTYPPAEPGQGPRALLLQTEAGTAQLRAELKAHLAALHGTEGEKSE